jgi:hypothetical protein
MANTYVKIGSTVTVGSGGAANIEFTSIPATYTDLVVKASLRGSTNGNIDMLCEFNGVTTGYNFRWISGDGTSAGSANGASANAGLMDMNNDTASTFASNELYIPNYLSSNNKSLSFDAVTENNATTAYRLLGARLSTITSAITSIKLLPQPGNFVQYSTATLYGIKSS